MSFYTEFAASYERVFPPRDATLAFLRRWLPPAGRVIDLGCGPGHHVGRLAESTALLAVGVDLDEGMIAAARERYPAAEFHALDLREAADLTGPADGAYCIGNVLPHLPPPDLDRFLGRLHHALAPGAPFLVQTVNFDRLLPLRAPFDFPPIDAGDGLVFHRRYDDGGDGRLRFLTELRADGRPLFAGDETLWPLRADGLARRCAAAGFTITRRFGDFVGAPFDPATSGAFVLVAHRGDA